MLGRLCSASLFAYIGPYMRMHMHMLMHTQTEAGARRARWRVISVCTISRAPWRVYTLAESCTEISRSGARCGLRGHTETLLPIRTGPVVDTDTF